VKIPHSYRSGGSLDSFIDGFHVLLGNRRFNRELYEFDEYHFSVKTNSEEYYTDNEALNGIANVKPKLKYWLWHWENDLMPGGLAFSLQAKIPTQDDSFAGTTGEVDYYALMHLGVPLGYQSGMWITGAYSYLSENPSMKDWPVNRNYQMYELSFDFHLVDEWSMGLMARAQSPYLDVDQLRYTDTETDPKQYVKNRTASGWNALVRWRGTEGLGFKYSSTKDSQISFWIVEDWGIGPYDASDDIYSNGSPDVNLVIQTSIGW